MFHWYKMFATHIEIVLESQRTICWINPSFLPLFLLIMWRTISSQNLCNDILYWCWKRNVSARYYLLITARKNVLPILTRFFFFSFLLGLQIWMNAALPPLTVVARSVKTARVHSCAHAMMDSTFKQIILPVLVRRNLNKHKCQLRGH